MIEIVNCNKKQLRLAWEEWAKIRARVAEGKGTPKEQKSVERWQDGSFSGGLKFAAMKVDVANGGGTEEGASKRRALARWST